MPWLAGGISPRSLWEIKMDISSRKQMIGFILVAGLFFYLASALWSALFIVSLPQEKDWCKEWFRQERETRFETVLVEECVEFNNTLEELKYYHNREMYDRNRYWGYGCILAGALLVIFVFHVIPKWRGRLNDSLLRSSETWLVALLLGFVVSVVVPLVLGWILPAPVKWFPDEIVRIAELREQEELEILKEVARAQRTLFAHH